MPLPQFFFVRASVISYVVLDVSFFVPHLSFLRCLGSITKTRLFKYIYKKKTSVSPGSAIITSRKHEEEEETDKTKQTQIEQTYEKH